MSSSQGAPAFIGDNNLNNLVYIGFSLIGFGLVLFLYLLLADKPEQDDKCEIEWLGPFQLLCPTSNLLNMDWVYQSSSSKINSFKFQISSTKFQINLKFQWIKFQTCLNHWKFEFGYYLLFVNWCLEFSQLKN